MAEEDAERRRELGRFLRSRREQAVRADHGLPPVGRSRDRGLRREEVAVLAGVSVTWYTWVEQGRPIHPSQSVLDALARALRLTRAEHEFILSLAGMAVGVADAVTAVRDAPPHLQRLLDALDPNPAFALAPDWGIAGWNDAYQRLYPNVATVSRSDRNLLWAVFTDPAVRDLLPDWDVTSRRFLAEFRAEAGGRTGHPGVRAIVERLSAASPEFRSAWDAYDVRGFASRERTFRIAPGGTVRFEHHQLAPTDHPDLRVVVYTRMP